MKDICIPRSIQVVIDDVGWWTGKDSSGNNGPYRTGIERNHHPLDYEAVAQLGRRLKMRPQAAFIISEWDRDDQLKNLPAATHMGSKWNNPWKSSPMLDEAGKMIRDNHDLFELTLHGIGHEYWKTGMMSRAEWHDENGTMRPKESVAAHLRVFLKLLKQNDLGPFPESFVPTAFLHRFGAGEEGLPGMLAEYGVKYMSTPFSMMHAVKQPESDLFGIDGPLITVNRGKDLCEWNEIAPDVAGEIHGPICGMHWPNLLHPDPDRNGEVVERWGRLLETYQRRFDTMLAPNTAEGFSQLIYRWGTELQYDDFGCKLDFSKLSSCKPPGLLDSFTLKVERKWNIVSSSPEIHLFENQQQSTTEYKSILIKRQSSAKSAYIHWKLNEESD